MQDKNSPTYFVEQVKTALREGTIPDQVFLIQGTKGNRIAYLRKIQYFLENPTGALKGFGQKHATEQLVGDIQSIVAITAGTMQKQSTKKEWSQVAVTLVNLQPMQRSTMVYIAKRDEEHNIIGWDEEYIPPYDTNEPLLDAFLNGYHSKAH